MIYVRTGLLRSAAGAVVLWVGTVLATLFLFAAALRSQDSAAPPKAAAEQPPKAAAEMPAKSGQLGLVLAEATKVRSARPTAASARCCCRSAPSAT